jgi:alginate O-acetyltransferase complex protein AlgI
MAISDLIFIFCFLPFCLVIYYVMGDKLKKYVLLVLNVLFYFYADSNYILLMLISVGVNTALGYGIYRCVNKRCKQVLLILGWISNVSVLGYYKYSGFLIANVNTLFKTDYHMESLVLPLGVSFFTFKGISFLMDVYSGEVTLKKNPVYSLLYLSFFPQIISGPLSRYSDMWGTVDIEKDAINDLMNGICRFMKGFSKKILLANMLGNIVDEIFSMSTSQLSVGLSWLGAVCFTLEIYYDFSGYSDMAIGLTNMFGYGCPDNFNYPYMASSFSDFWRRWHITLGAWFRDYVYIPLGGSRVKSTLRLVLNLFVVWLFTGIWHGAGWKFVVWGLIYFVLISFEKIIKLPDKLKYMGIKVLYHVFVLLIVNFAWVIFRADSLKDGIFYIGSMFAGNNQIADARAIYLLKNYSIILVVAILFCFPILPAIEKRLTQSKLQKIWECGRSVVSCIVFVVAVAFLVAGNNSPFVYSNF